MSRKLSKDPIEQELVMHMDKMCDAYVKVRDKLKEYRRERKKTDVSSSTPITEEA